LSSTLDFARLERPREHAETLIAPPAGELAATLAGNREILGQYRFQLLDRPVQEVRAEVRAACGVPDDRPVVLTGHQPAFIHPGIWVKHILATRLASAVGGVAANLVVENDAPPEFVVRVPHEPPDRPGHIVALKYADVARGTPFEHLRALAREEIDRLEAEVREGLAERWPESLAETFFAALREQAGAADYVAQMLAARRAVEAEFGVTLADWRSGQVWGGPLAGEILLNARRFAEAYNGALAAWGGAAEAPEHHQPFPTIEVSSERIELPFWAYRPGGTRRRVVVEEHGAELTILADKEPIGRFQRESVTEWHSCARMLESLRPWVLRPRALALTLWARLLGSDLFIHGLGGANYDRVTDEVIRRYFGVEPPAFVCASATLLWSPEAAAAQCWLELAQRRVRDFQYNPQKFADPRAHADLLAARREAVTASARLREVSPDDHAARRRAFDEIRQANAALGAAMPELERQLRDELAESQRRSVRGRIGQDREVFFAFYPRQELRRLVEAVPGVQAFG
jgi:hypothetical protein